MGKRLSDDAESNNIQHLNSFRGYWSSSAEYPEENHGNNHVRMPVNVLYEWADGYSRVGFVSEFRAFIGSGPDDGTIDIADTSKVRIKDFHLQFKPAFQSYRFDAAAKTLTISDTSPKMGGRYNVVVSPTIEAPANEG